MKKPEISDSFMYYLKSEKIDEWLAQSPFSRLSGTFRFQASLEDNNINTKPESLRFLISSSTYQVYKYETGNFFEKVHVYLIKMVTHSIFKVMAIASHTFFPSLWQFVYASLKKLFLFWVKPVIEPLFHIFVRIEVLFSKCVPHWWK